jgi:hypothetical protein
VQSYVEGDEVTAFFLDATLLGAFRVDSPDGIWSRHTKETNTASFTPYAEPATVKRIESVGAGLVSAGVRNLFRADLVVQGHAVVILEVNTLPYLGGQPGSSVSALLGQLGVSHYAFLDRVASNAMERAGVEVGSPPRPAAIPPQWR